MKPALSLAGALVVLAMLARPGSLAEPSPSPRTHVVRAGESLWEIAREELGQGERWREILSANPGVAPDHLRVGQVLRIPPRETTGFRPPSVR